MPALPARRVGVGAAEEEVMPAVSWPTLLTPPFSSRRSWVSSGVIVDDWMRLGERGDWPIRECPRAVVPEPSHTELAVRFCALRRVQRNGLIELCMPS